MASLCSEHQQTLDLLMQEFTEYPPLRFKIQAKDYEEALECEISEKDLKIEELSYKLNSLNSDYKTLRKKYETESFEMVRVLNEVDSLRK